MNRTGPIKVDNSQRQIGGSAFAKTMPSGFSSLNQEDEKTKLKKNLHVVSPSNYNSSSGDFA